MKITDLWTMDSILLLSQENLLISKYDCISSLQSLCKFHLPLVNLSGGSFTSVS